MLKNKHVIAAMLIAPVLSILAYFAVDSWVSEPAKPPEPGRSYPMTASSKCRYESGKCEFKNGNFKLTLSASRPVPGMVSLAMLSEFPLRSALVSLADASGEESPPREMLAVSMDGKEWLIRMRQSDMEGEAAEGNELRLVVATEDNLYYGNTGVVFTRYETSFGKDFRDTETN